MAIVPVVILNKIDPEKQRTCTLWNPDIQSPFVGFLPPIKDIEIPKGSTQSVTIRWLHAVGYTVAEIHHYLGVKYQMVRNIITTVPKRAAREDLFPLVVHLRPINEEPIVDALDAALDASLMVGRKERREQEQED